MGVDNVRRACRGGRWVAASLTVCLAAAWLAPAGAGASPLAVTALIAPQAWLVEQVGGDRVEVTALIAPGTSPETFHPSDAEISRVLRSSLFFHGGLPSERGPWLEAIRRSRRVTLVDLRQGIELLRLPRHHHDVAAAAARTEGHGHHEESGDDPHTWLSPSRLKAQAALVAAALERADPENGAEYRSRRQQVEARLDRLDQEIEQRLAPHRGRAFLVFHPAWGYFADEYGLRQLALEIEGKSPTEAEVTQLQRLARSQGISVVFVQPQIRGAAAVAVAAAIGGRLEVLDPLQADVAANLQHVTDRLVALFEASGGPPRSAGDP